jgi:maltose phosphorylase
MGGTWMSFVQGFGGMRVIDNMLHFSPFIPKTWEAYSFRINFRGSTIKIAVNKDDVSFENHSQEQVVISVYEKDLLISPMGNGVTPLKK